MNISLHQLLVDLQRRGLEISTIYDVGAEGGVWSQNTKRHACPNSEFILFEANPAYRDQLQATGFRFFNDHAISNPGREQVDFYRLDALCGEQNGGNSYYKETTSWYDQSQAITLPCTTIDDLVKKHNLPLPNMIKLDTQGSELDVLQGCESVIEHVDLIHIECPIIEYNKHSPSIGDYLDYFKSKRFIPLIVTEIHSMEATLLQIDIVFMDYDSKQKYTCENNFIRPFG